MPNFAAIAFIDTWHLSAMLRGKLSMFADDGALRVVEVTDEMRQEWKALANVLSRISRIDGVADYQHEPPRLEMLMPRSGTPWDFETGAIWRRAVLPLVTNPLAVLFCGTEWASPQTGVLTVMNLSPATSQVNLGDYPRVHLVVDFKAREEVP